MRFLRAIREYNLERDTSLEAVAFYTDPDARTPFVRLYDDSVHLGPAMRSTPAGMISAYCDHDHVIALLLETGCDAVWPGWGFIAEDAAFVARLEAEGITFIGPSSEAMFRLGDKIEAKLLAEKAGVPLAPWYLVDPKDNDTKLRAEAARIGYPLMVKASAGGGGRGIRKVDAEADLLGAIRSALDEVAKIFGAGGLMIESCVTGARHIEVQLVVGADGKAEAMGIRDCTIQRRHQKVVEESPSPVLPDALGTQLCESSARLAEMAGYVGVATAEYLYDPANNTCCFLEVNSRLQVEHTVTECVFGSDLVQAQIDIARGLPWLRGCGVSRGHAIEVRVNAENPEQGFAPSPGKVRVFRAPSGPGVRVDSGVTEGVTIAPEFDSMIAKIIAWAPTRKQAVVRLVRALQELELVVEDGATNKSFLVDLLDRPEFVESTADTAWLDRAMGSGDFAAPAWEFEAVLAAAVLEYRRERFGEITRFFAETENGIPQSVSEPVGMAMDLKIRGRGHSVEVYALGDGVHLVGPPDALQMVSLVRAGSHTAEMRFAGQRHKVLFAFGSAGVAVEVDGVMHHVERASGGVVRSPSPAMVVHVTVAVGDVIAAGDRLCTLEAMKMEMAVVAQEGGIVRSVMCQANEQVSAGQPLVILESDGEDGDTRTTAAELPPVRPRPADTLFVAGEPRPDIIDGLDEQTAALVIDDAVSAARSMLLGFDASPLLARRLESLFKLESSFSTLQHPERWIEMADLLDVFADTEALFDRNMILESKGAAAVGADQAFYDFCRLHREGEDGVQPALLAQLQRTLALYRVHSLDPSDSLREALWRLAVGHASSDLKHRLCSFVMRCLMQLHRAGCDVAGLRPNLRGTLDRVATLTTGPYSAVTDNARQAMYVLFERSRYVQRRQVVQTMLRGQLALLSEASTVDARTVVDALVNHPHDILELLIESVHPSTATAHYVAEAIVRRLHLGTPCRLVQGIGDQHAVGGLYHLGEGRSEKRLAAVLTASADFDDAVGLVVAATKRPTRKTIRYAEVVLTDVVNERTFLPTMAAKLDKHADALQAIERFTVSWRQRAGGQHHRNYCWRDGKFVENTVMRNVHPEAANRIGLNRLEEFQLERLDSPELIYAFRGRAHGNPRDERVFVFAEITQEDASAGPCTTHDLLWEFEQVYFEAIAVFREEQSKRNVRERLHFNWLTIVIRPVVSSTARDVAAMAKRFESSTRGLGLNTVALRATVENADSPTGYQSAEFVVRKPGRHRLEVVVQKPNNSAISAMTDYDLRLVRTRRLGYIFPYETARMLEGKAGGVTPHPDMARGHFQEYDLDASNQLVPVHREPGQNTASVVVGSIINYTQKHPEGMERIWIASDPTKSMGALSEPECRRVLGAIDLADKKGLPVEWLPVSAGARISMESGTENLDWTAAVLKRLVEFTQAGGEVNLIVAGVNVGAQSYWNAEATMLMHTKGVLIMTRDGSMVLTGKKALEYSGGVAAEDEKGIGGYSRIMGPNGQAQYFARDMGEAYAILFEHYRFSYKGADDKSLRRFPTTDPTQRSILDFPYHPVADETFRTIGEIFSDETNAGRKKPFAIRQVMHAVRDQDGGFIERFPAMRHGDSSVVWDAHIGGVPVCVIGIESRPMSRIGRVPMDGPDTWTGGTLFPQSSKKVARGINAASGNRPVVVLANLSGFDGSPESLRKLQLEHGAEIGRAVTNFDGPMVFVVIGRYHGGAYVVFSKALNPNLRSLALEGSYASVIGGAPAAAVVFPRDVRKLTQADARVVEAKAKLDAASSEDQPMLRERLAEIVKQATLEKQGEVAAKFDAIHTVERAVRVGSLDAVISPVDLRPGIIAELRRALGPDTWSPESWQHGNQVPGIEGATTTIAYVSPTADPE